MHSMHIPYGQFSVALSVMNSMWERHDVESMNLSVRRFFDNEYHRFPFICIVGHGSDVI